MEKLRYERVASAVGTESISQFFQQKDFNKEKHFIEYRKILETINDVNFSTFLLKVTFASFKISDC